MERLAHEQAAQRFKKEFVILLKKVRHCKMPSDIKRYLASKRFSSNETHFQRDISLKIKI